MFRTGVMTRMTGEIRLYCGDDESENITLILGARLEGDKHKTDRENRIFYIR